MEKKSVEVSPSLALYANNPRRAITLLETGEGCIYCGRKYHEENQCWKKFPHLMPDWVKGEKKEQEGSEQTSALVTIAFQI
jgi:hypothetical protein